MWVWKIVLFQTQQVWALLYLMLYSLARFSLLTFHLRQWEKKSGGILNIIPRNLLSYIIEFIRYIFSLPYYSRWLCWQALCRHLTKVPFLSASNNIFLFFKALLTASSRPCRSSRTLLLNTPLVSLTVSSIPFQLLPTVQFQSQCHM